MQKITLQYSFVPVSDLHFSTHITQAFVRFAMTTVCMLMR
jgi:hypothetical protein